MTEAAVIRVLVADDHLVMRLGLETLIGAEPDLRVVGMAADGRQAIEMFRQQRPDVALLDLNMPGVSGVTAIRTLCAEDPDARLIVLTIHRGDEAVYQALEAGARGYLLKDTPGEEIAAAIRAVHAGRRYLPPEVAEQMASRLQFEPLTPREIEALKGIAAGLSNREIGARMDIAENTARNYVATVLDKLAVRDRTRAVVVALERGILDLRDVSRDDPGASKK
jgi:two-component system NarL family response regulator